MHIYVRDARFIDTKRFVLQGLEIGSRTRNGILRLDSFTCNIILTDGQFIFMQQNAADTKVQNTSNECQENVATPRCEDQR